MRQARTGIIVGIAALFLVLTASAAFAIDAPHNNLTSCRNCHDLLASGSYTTGGLIDNTPVNQACQECHRTGGAAADFSKVTHSSRTTGSELSYGPWATDCIDCHDPHNQEQIWFQENNVYVNMKAYNGTADSGALLETATVTGVVANEVSVTFANAGGWPTDQWVGYTLIDTTRPPSWGLSYKIVNSTAGQSAVINTVRPIYDAGLGSVAIAYGKMMRGEMRTGSQVVNSNGTVPGGDGFININVWRPVKFFNSSGIYSPAWSINAQDAVCVVCHLKTASFNMGYAQYGEDFDGIVEDYANTWHKDNPSDGATNCWTTSGCHELPKEGFDADCSGCHGQPPSDATVVNQTSSNNYPWYSGMDAGAHQAHVAKGKGTCTYCHDGGGAEDPEHKFDDQITMGFSNVLSGEATFVNGLAFANSSWIVESGDAGTTIVDDSSDVRTCTGIYCHSDGASLASAFAQTPDWDGGSLNCNSCHASPMIVDAHDKHASGGTNDYQFDCYECHGDTTDQGDNSTVPAIKNAAHVNFVKTIAWGNVSSGSGAYDLGTANCDNVYCHGPTAAALETPNWDSSLSDECASCHDKAGATISNLPDAHDAHTNTTGNSYNCTECHDTVLTDDTTISDYSLHVNGLNTVDASEGFAANACSTTICHGPAGSPTWATDLSGIDDCTKCHGVQTAGSATEIQMAPGGTGQDLDGNISAADANVGAHLAHLNASAGISNNIDCVSCHDVPATPTSAGHIDASRPAEVPFNNALSNNSGALSPAYNVGTNSCANTYCHGNKMPFGTSPGVGNTPVWANTTYLDTGPDLTGDCDKCHLSPPDVLSYHNADQSLSDCDTCHLHLDDDGTFNDPSLHIDGLVQGIACTGCHGQPPENALTMVNTVATLKLTQRTEGDFAATAWGQHSYHAVGKGYICQTCHNGGGSTGNDHITSPFGNVTMGFRINAVDGGTFNAPAIENSTVYRHSQGPSTTVNNLGAIRACYSIYCHSDGAGGVPNALANWDTGDGSLTSGDCKNCHGDATDLVVTTMHPTHVGSYDFTCSECHAGTVDADKAIPAGKIANHVNFGVDVIFSNVAAGGSWSGTATKQCSSLYCHSDGLGGNPNTNPPDWDAAFPTDCIGCHDNDKDAAGGNVMNSGSHTTHINNAAYVGRILECYDCHAATMDMGDNQAIGSGKLAKHVDGAIDNLVAVDASECSNIRCHSDGNYGATVKYNDAGANWGSLDYKCGNCHGDGSTDPEPAYANTGAAIGNYNSHDKHVVALTDCANCHDDTTSDGESVTTTGIHVDGVVNVAIAGAYDDNADKYDNYTSGTRKCTNLYCHNTGTPVWGSASLACNECHDASSELPGSHAKHYNTTTVAADYTAGRVSNTTAYEFKCGVCHDDTVHAGGEVTADSTAEVLFNDTYAGASAYNSIGGTPTADGNFSWTNTVCSSTKCHDDGTGGVPNTTPIWNSAAMACDSCHNALPITNAHSKHIAGGTVMANALCDTCHEDTASDITNSALEDYDWHVNGVINVIMNTAAGGTFDDGTNVCSTSNCHDDGLGGGPNTTPDWTSTLPAGCIGCHNNDKDTASPMITGSHATHLDNSTYVGSELECYDCHAGTLDIGNRVIGSSKIGNHVNGTIDNRVAMDGTACNNIRCHSDGNYDGTIQYNDAWANWGSLDYKCGKCHGDGSTDPEPGYANAPASSDENSHDEHMSAGTDCANCHSDTTADGSTVFANSIHVDGVVNVAIAGAYDSNADKYDNFTKGTNTCTNVYCHSTGQNASGGTPPVYNSPVWGIASSAQCGKCHLADGVQGDASTMQTQAHNEHLAYGGVNIACNDCHDGLGSGQANHADQNVNHAFLAANAGASAAYSNSGFAAGDSLYGECSSVYCHGDFTGGNVVSPRWDDATAACGTCHASSPTSNAHDVHLALTGVTLTCIDCHGHEGSNTHVGMVVNGILNSSAWFFNSSSTYGGSGTWSDGKADSATTSTCATVMCHSMVQETTGNGQTLDGSAGDYKTPDWGGSITDCVSCHNDGTAGTAIKNGAPASGTHPKHVTDNNYTCDKCHVSGGSYAVANHPNNQINVANATNISGGYSDDTGAPGNSTYGTCSTVACHGDNDADWGGAALTCRDCHFSESADYDDYIYGNGDFALIKNTGEWLVEGHGGTVAYASGNPAANFDVSSQDGCRYCHDNSAGAPHDDAANPFRLYNSSNGEVPDVDGWNDICLACHDSNTTDSAFDPTPGDVLADVDTTGVVKVDKWHQMAAHGLSPNNGGRFCWDCHDPHGDNNNMMMIHARTAKKTDGVYGNPGNVSNLVGAPIVFTDNTKATAVGGFAVNTTRYNEGAGDPYAEGVCNACHTNSAADPKMEHYNDTTSDDHNQGGICTSCHKHSKDAVNDGNAFQGGSCSGCHGYPPDALDGKAYLDTSTESKGAHVVHVNHLLTVGSLPALDPDADTFDHAVDKFEKVCGVCHSTATHETGDPAAGNRTVIVNTTYTFGPTGNATYTGTPGTDHTEDLKTCSNVDCHFRTSPEWQSYP